MAFKQRVKYSSSAEDAKVVLKRITDAGGRAVAVKADISEPEQIKPLFDAAIEHFGRLDILINNAGIYKVATLDSVTAENFNDPFNLNVRGLLLMTQAAARVLPDVGVIVNISSGSARAPFPWCMFTVQRREQWIP